MTPEEQQYFEGYEPRKRGKASIPKEQGQDVIFDTLERLWCGPGVKGTRRERDKIAIAAAELKALKEKEVNPAEIECRWFKWNKDYPNIPCTPLALSGNWHSLAEKKPKIDPAEEAQRQAYLADVQARNKYINSLSDEEFADRAQKAVAWLDEMRKGARQMEVRYFPPVFRLKEIERDNLDLVQVLWWAENKRREAEKQQ